MPQELNREPMVDSASGASRRESSGSDPSSGSVRGAAAQAKDAAARLSAQAAQEVKDQAARYADDGKHAVTEHLDSFAQAIRKAGDELSERDQTVAAQMVRQAARGLESLSRSVNGASLEDMIASVRRFGRSHPAALIGGAVLAGLALGRFARASGRRRLDDSDEWAAGRGAQSDAADGWSSGATRDVPISPYSGSSYPAGERSSFAPPSRGTGDTAGAPSAAQGYAGGGMGTSTAAPSSATEPSVTGSDYSGGSEPGAISTGGSS